MPIDPVFTCQGIPGQIWLYPKSLELTTPTIYALMYLYSLKTSLLRRLQAQTILDATPQIGKMHSIIKNSIPFKPTMRF